MTFSIKRLYDLQELDWKISAAEGELVRVRADLADDSALLAAKEKVDHLRAELSDAQSRRKMIDVELQEVLEKLKSVEAKVYGGAVTSAREYSAFEDERDFLRRQQREQEDSLLELMVEIEELEQASAEAEEDLTRVEDRRAAERERLLAEETRLTGEQARLAGEREQTTPEVPPSTLSLYELLSKGGNGHAVAKVERGLCQGCRLALPTKDLQRARSGQGLVQCNSCRRILYVA